MSDSDLDLVIRRGTVVDGTGVPARVADVAVRDGRVVEVGTVAGHGADEIDADGLLVTPGFVDIHTHYDGQATWDPRLVPSSWHGVTTVVMGNCGVGFAPVRPAERQRLIDLMEGVEDIPGTALHEGLPWTWETYPEYLDALATLPRDIDLGSQLTHGALRLYVMGDRAAAGEPATPDDIARMGDLAREAIEAGALGFSTDRTVLHRTSRGDHTPTLRASLDELLGIGERLRDAGAGVLQVFSDFDDVEAEFSLLRTWAAESGRPLSMSIVQLSDRPDLWRELLVLIEAASACGVTMRGQVAARGAGVLLGLEATLNPFMYSPAYLEIADLPLVERVRRMRRPEVRRAIVDGVRVDADKVLGSAAIEWFDRMFPLGDPVSYEPDPSRSVAAQARREGRPPIEVAYDLLLERDGDALLYVPFGNWAGDNLDVVREQLVHPLTVVGLSDAGAHVGTVCDGSFPTTLLQWWGRDRPRGRLPLELLVHKQAQATAEAVGLLDRGVLAPGYLADLNVIDHEGLTLHAPEWLDDLPAGGRRLVQRASGYRYTIKRGVAVVAEGTGTGALPGQLLRGGQPAPIG